MYNVQYICIGSLEPSHFSSFVLIRDFNIDFITLLVFYIPIYVIFFLLFH